MQRVTRREYLFGELPRVEFEGVYRLELGHVW
jgi:hypothetical protein